MFPFRKYKTVTQMMIMKQNLLLFSSPLLSLVDECEMDTYERLLPLMQLSQMMIADAELLH
jgi:hypothetical protein